MKLANKNSDQLTDEAIFVEIKPVFEIEVGQPKKRTSKEESKVITDFMRDNERVSDTIFDKAELPLE